jgi:hypothetical protein
MALMTKEETIVPYEAIVKFNVVGGEIDEELRQRIEDALTDAIAKEVYEFIDGHNWRVSARRQSHQTIVVRIRSAIEDERKKALL